MRLLFKDKKQFILVNDEDIVCFCPFKPDGEGVDPRCNSECPLFEIRKTGSQIRPYEINLHCGKGRPGIFIKAEDVTE